MGSILLGIANAVLIEQLGGCQGLFSPVQGVDSQLSNLGIVVVIWYVGTWLSWLYDARSAKK